MNKEIEIYQEEPSMLDEKLWLQSQLSQFLHAM